MIMPIPPLPIIGIAAALLLKEEMRKMEEIKAELKELEKRVEENKSQKKK